MNAHSTLWYSHTDDHRGQLISDIIINSEHIIQNTDTPTRVPHTALRQATSPDITTLYNCATWHAVNALNSDHLLMIATVGTQLGYELPQDTHSRTVGGQAGCSSFQTRRLLSLTFGYHRIYTLQTPSSHALFSTQIDTTSRRKGCIPRANCFWNTWCMCWGT